MNTGSRLGPYEILAPIGAGGMGEVYKARDTRLNRTVAIKVLPPEVRQHPDRQARFEREARAISQLSHPHICALFDVGRDGDTDYLVMELLDGESLAARLARGALPVAQALRVGTEIAQALAAAHTHGVVHRDLKPGNVMLTPNGAKLLDFGLAKLKPQGEAAVLASDASAPTATQSLTLQGQILGTLPYMAPEQVEGKPADGRSDLWALGAILYEMLAGKRAFEGDSSAKLIGAIAATEPVPLTTRQPLTPPPVERLVARCLAKSPDDRFQDARDVAFALEAVAGPVATPAPATTTQRPVWRSPWVVAALLLIVGAVGGWLGFTALRTDSSVPTYSQLTFRPGNITAARFAPDGQTVVYSAAWEGGPTEVYAGRIGSPEARRLDLNGQLLSISRSGELLVLRGTTLSRASLAGGAPRQIIDDVVDADWDAEGREPAVVRRAGGRLRVEYPIGKPIYNASGTAISDFRVLPDASLAFFESTDPFPAALRIVPAAGNSRTLAQSITTWMGLAWHPATREIWMATARGDLADPLLRAVDLSGHERVVARVPGQFRLWDVDDRGRLLMNAGLGRLRLMVCTPADARERELSWFDFSRLVDLSPDASRMLITETSGTTRDGVYLRNTDGSDAVRLGDGWALALSPDGLWALARSDSGDSLLLHPTGPGERRRLQSTVIPRVFDSGSWLPDGRSVVVIGGESGSRARVYVWEIAGGAPRPISPEGVYDVVRASPDGRWVAAGGGAGPTLCSVSGGDPRPVPSHRNDELPAGWSADSRSLFVWSVEGRTARIDRIDIASGQRQPWKVLSPADVTGSRGIRAVTVTPDGRGYSYHYYWRLDRLYLVEGMK